MKKKFWIGLQLLGALFLLAPLSARADDALPPDVFTVLMLKSQSYDRNVARQAKDKIVIGIVYASSDPLARKFAGAVNTDIGKVASSFMLRDKAVSSTMIELENSFDQKVLERQLTQANVSILVVINNVPSAKRIFQATRNLGINSICNDPECPRQGVGLGIIQRDNKPLMMINLASMKAEGSDYSANFLTLGEQVS